MTIRARGRLLLASKEDRKLRYLLLPYGEAGSTNKGRILASAGSVEIPAESLPVNLEHDDTRPVGTMTVTEAAAGLEAEVDVANTRAGDDVLEEAAAGLRAGISVEIDNPVIRAGKLIAGLLSGAGLVVKPAYPSATLLAADFGDVPPDADADADETTDPLEDLDAAKAALESGDAEAAQAAVEAALDKIKTDPAPAPEPKEPTVKVTAAQSANPTAALLAALNAGGFTGAEPKEETETLAQFTASFRKAVDLQDTKLRASHLETMTQTDLYDPAVQPAWLGELWAKAPYTEIWTDVVAKEGLTALTYKGYRWMEENAELGIDGEPVVDDWDPAFIDRDDEDNDTPGHAKMMPIPTGAMRLESKDFHARRLAGGNRFDRALLDFPVPGVLESFLSMQTETIKKRRDARTRTAVLAQAARGLLKPSQYTSGDLENTWRRIILGAMHVMDYGKPTYAVVGNDEYRQMLGTDMLENLALLEKSLGLEGGTMSGFKIKPASIKDTEMSGRVIVGVDKAVVLHEPAGTPIRVDAQDLAVGAIDKAVFSYYMLRSDDRGGVVEVPKA